MSIELKILNKVFYEEYSLPHYATSGSAGIDLVTTRALTIFPGDIIPIPTGLSMHIGSECDNLMGVVVPRSGLGTKGLVLANTIGIIDEDYQGEIIIQAWNKSSATWISNEPIVLKAGDRIAQLIFVPVMKARFSIVEEFTNKTSRGDGGFGSTGK